MVNLKYELIIQINSLLTQLGAQDAVGGPEGDDRDKSSSPSGEAGKQTGLTSNGGEKL